MPEFVHSSTLARREPPWASLALSKLPAIAFAQAGPDPRVWQYGHHWVDQGTDPDGDGRFEGGTMYLHLEGLDQAWGFATGRWNGVPQASLEVVAHLRLHFVELGYTAEELQGRTQRAVLADIDRQLVEGGYLQPDELVSTVQARVQRFVR